MAEDTSCRMGESLDETRDAKSEIGRADTPSRSRALLNIVGSRPPKGRPGHYSMRPWSLSYVVGKQLFRRKAVF